MFIRNYRCSASECTLIAIGRRLIGDGHLWRQRCQCQIRPLLLLLAERQMRIAVVRLRIGQLLAGHQDMIEGQLVLAPVVVDDVEQIVIHRWLAGRRVIVKCVGERLDVIWMWIVEYVGPTTKSVSA